MKFNKNHVKKINMNEISLSMDEEIPMIIRRKTHKYIDYTYEELASGITRIKGFHKLYNAVFYTAFTRNGRLVNPNSLKSVVNLHGKSIGHNDQPLSAKMNIKRAHRYLSAKSSFAEL